MIFCTLHAIVIQGQGRSFIPNAWYSALKVVRGVIDQTTPGRRNFYATMRENYIAESKKYFLYNIIETNHFIIRIHCIAIICTYKN